ncbi:MAG: hypothetical protein DIU68_000525 [Chloroflexota bacterium]
MGSDPAAIWGEHAITAHAIRKQRKQAAENFIDHLNRVTHQPVSGLRPGLS